MTTENASLPEFGVYHFGAFRLDTQRRLLERDGVPVQISARALDILHLLIEARHRVVSRDEIFAHVWPGLAVEPSNLTVQMSALRRALGETGEAPIYIATVTGRGYRFIGRLHATENAVPPSAMVSGAPPRPLRRHTARMIAAALALAATALFALRPTRPPPPHFSIVVLPFLSLGSDRNQDYLAEAISDDLTTDMSRIPGSVVISRETADTYKGKTVSAEAIGRALNVRYLLEGSLRAEGRQLRINAQLIDTVTSRHVWADRLDTSADKLMDAQTDIVRRLANTLDIAMTEAAARAITEDHRPEQDSRDLFLRARAAIAKANTRADMTAAQKLLEQAIAADPDYVDALATLGWLLVRKEQSYTYPDAAADDAEADRVIAHAMSLAPNNPRVLAARGRYLQASGRCAEAEAALETALAADPNNVQALTGMALCAWRTGQPDKTIEALSATLQVDPQGPGANRRYQTLGLAKLFAGRPRDAIADLLRADAQDGDVPAETDTAGPKEADLLYLIAAYRLAGDAGEAARRYAAFAATFRNRTVWRLMAQLPSALRRLPQAAKIADAWAASGMPRFADPHKDFHVPTAALPLAGGDFSPTPTMLRGAETIDTARLRGLLAGPHRPRLLDVGDHVAVPEGALAVSDADAASGRARFDAMLNGAAGFVVMGTGTTGTDGYNAALHVVGLGYDPVYWYRGGEEAWASQGLPARDLSGGMARE